MDTIFDCRYQLDSRKLNPLIVVGQVSLGRPVTTVNIGKLDKPLEFTKRFVTHLTHERVGEKIGKLKSLTLKEHFVKSTKLCLNIVFPMGLAT